MHLLENCDGQWQSSCDVTGNGSEVYRIEFVNLDKDSQLEISVVWTLSDSKRNKTLSLYKPTSMNSSSTQKSLTQISSTQVSDYTFGDMDFDNQNEIFYTYFTFEGDSPVYSSVIARVDDTSSNLIPLSEVALSKNIDQLVNMTTDVKDAVFSVYIDCLANDGRYFTEIVSFDYVNRILLRPLTSDGTAIALQTYRYNQFLSQDINSDFMVEIPAQNEFAGSYFEGETSSEKIYVTSYYQYVEGKLICTDSYYINNTYDFRIHVADYFDITYLLINEEKNTFQFRLKECSEDDDLLFTVTVNQNEQSDEKFTFYITPLGERYSFTDKKLSGLIEEM